jgi:hypothetical protein
MQLAIGPAFFFGLDGLRFAFVLIGIGKWLCQPAISGTKRVSPDLGKNHHTVTIIWESRRSSFKGNSGFEDDLRRRFFRTWGRATPRLRFVQIRSASER